MLDGIFPWSAPVAGLPVVLSVAVARQYVSGFLIGCGVGGVVGASTLGVAMFSLSAPTGELRILPRSFPSSTAVLTWVPSSSTRSMRTKLSA